MIRVLVIGGDSFIAKRFIQRNEKLFDISTISRFSTYYKKEFVCDNFECISSDWFYNIDVVINFVAIVHQPNTSNTALYNRVNFEYAMLFAKKAQENHVRHFIQMSSVAVYGNSEIITVDSTYKPLNEYGYSKLKADLELMKMDSNDFCVSIIRPPLVYGGGLAPGNMIKLIKQVEKGVFLPFKNVKNKRSFVNIWNLVDCLALVITQRQFGIVLIADKAVVSTSKLIEIISSSLGVETKLIQMPSLLLLLLKMMKPNFYYKLFGSSVVVPNIFSPHDFYDLESGIGEMVASLKNKKQ